MKRKKIAIIGGGPAGMMAAYWLSAKHEVWLYEKEKTLGRKFLVAGKGGFNLTNAAIGDDLMRQYTPRDFMAPILQNFDTEACRKWLAQIGIASFVGSSGRVFPEKGIKPIQVLDNLKQALLANGTEIKLKHHFVGFDENLHAKMRDEAGIERLKADIYIFALGGASWSKTGSDGQWKSLFEDIGVPCAAFEASNCGVNINWPASVKVHVGKALKNMQFSVADHVCKGEAMISEYGLEGNAIYPLTPAFRKSFSTNSSTSIQLDFKPRNSLEQLLAKLDGAQTMKTKEYANRFQLHPQQLAILKAYTSKAEFLEPSLFVQKLKNLRIPVESLRSIEESISTVGGVELSALNVDLSLKASPNIFLAGEMLNWDAPTGGYLLQACFATAYTVAQAILAN